MQLSPGRSVRACVITAGNQVSSELDGEAVILELDKGMYYHLNAMGARIWQMIQKPQSMERICQQLVDEFQVSRRQCEDDVLVPVDKLVQAKLVSVRDEAHE